MYCEDINFSLCIKDRIQNIPRVPELFLMARIISFAWKNQKNASSFCANPSLGRVKGSSRRRQRDGVLLELCGVRSNGQERTIVVRYRRGRQSHLRIPNHLSAVGYGTAGSPGPTPVERRGQSRLPFRVLVVFPDSVVGPLPQSPLVQRSFKSLEGNDKNRVMEPPLDSVLGPISWKKFPL